MAKNKLLKLNVSQVLILKVLAHYDGELVTRDRLQRESGAVCDAENLGPVFLETLQKYPESLWGLGLVRSEGYYEQDEQGKDKMVTYWGITDEGKQEATRIQTRRKSTCYGKIPAKVIDPIAIAIKRTRTYGFEAYSMADLEEIRNKLPEKYQGISNDDLRSQLANRRKQGAFADKVEWPEWYTQYRTTQEFKEKEEQCLEFWHGRCVVNQNHDLDVTVVHRVFSVEVAEEDGGGIESVLYREEPTDLIPLCSKCMKRMEKQIPQPPATEPNIYGIDVNASTDEVAVVEESDEEEEYEEEEAMQE